MSAIILRRRKLGRTSCREIAKAMVSNCKVVRNDQQEFHPWTYAFRWGCTDNILNENTTNTHIINKASAIHLVNDKVKFRLLLQDKMPDNVPLTFTSIEEASAVGVTTSPLSQEAYVGRPKKHAQGRKLVHGNYLDCLAKVASWGGGYVSKYIPKVAEYRVAIVQGRVVWVAKKTPADSNAIAWNVAQGGSFENVNWSDWPLRAVRVSVEAFSYSGLDFGAVDIMVDADGKVYVLEINSAPSQTSPYRQQCFAKAFDYLIATNKAPIPLIEAKGGYKKFIHPAICNEAQLGG